MYHLEDRTAHVDLDEFIERYADEYAQAGNPDPMDFLEASVREAGWDCVADWEDTIPEIDTWVEQRRLGVPGE